MVVPGNPAAGIWHPSLAESAPPHIFPNGPAYYGRDFPTVNHSDSRGGDIPKTQPAS